MQFIIRNSKNKLSKQASRIYQFNVIFSKLQMYLVKAWLLFLWKPVLLVKLEMSPKMSAINLALFDLVSNKVLHFSRFEQSGEEKIVRRLAGVGPHNRSGTRTPISATPSSSNFSPNFSFWTRNYRDRHMQSTIGTTFIQNVQYLLIFLL